MITYGMLQLMKLFLECMYNMCGENIEIANSRLCGQTGSYSGRSDHTLMTEMYLNLNIANSLSQERRREDELLDDDNYRCVVEDNSPEVTFDYSVHLNVPKTKK